MKYLLNMEKYIYIFIKTQIYLKPFILDFIYY